MAVYRGKIDIVNMSDITATTGNGIQYTEVLYAVSGSGVAPPELVKAKLTTAEGQILSFAEAETTFHVVDEKLWVKQNDTLVELKVKDGYITDITDNEKWTETVPNVPQGYYLWTKTIFHYTNGEQTVIYNVSRQGKDGEPGPAGPAGTSAMSFKIECNQSEILKFLDESGNVSISPNILTVKIVKYDELSNNGTIQITDLNINEFIAEVYDLKTGVWHLIDKSFVSEELFSFNINLEELIKRGKEEEEEIEHSAAGLLLFEECIIKLSYTHYAENEDEEQQVFSMTEFLNIRYGMNKDMAQLSIKANEIVASMQDTKLLFGSHGLTVQNGSFKIEKTLEGGEKEALLFADDDGNLAIKGNIYADGGYFSGDITGASGTFSGTLAAESGYFKGDITGAQGTFSGGIEATTGTIGGFTIENSRLTSIKTNDKGVPNIILDGGEGIIEAENLTLGTGARIKEYIKIGEQLDENGTELGSVELRHAGSLNESFIKVTNRSRDEVLSLKADGTMRIGYGENSIIVSGADGSITSQNYQNGLGWRISNTQSIFNDVTVRGSIRASVLEYGETQAIGGALLVRPSSRILKAELSDSDEIATALTLEEITGFNIGDYCRIDIQTQSSLEHKFYKITSIQNKTITVSGDASSSQGKLIVSFGQASEDKERNDNVGISINGSIDNSFGTPQSISVFESIYSEEKVQLAPRIVLGKLPNNDETYGSLQGTYGLYAENVLLKGSLVTQTKTEDSGVKYSGISTIYGGNDVPKSTKLKDKIPAHISSEILLWAGADDTSKTSIENAKFFVDRNGNMYAGSGYFEGTIITDATITASAIETAVLRGSNDKPGEPALRIEDAANGIHFSTTNEEGEITTVFEVTKDSIVANVANFKFNSNFSIGGGGSLVVPNLYVIGDSTSMASTTQEGASAIVLDKHKISCVNNFDQVELTGNTRGYIDFANDLIFSPDGVKNVLTLSTQEVRVPKEVSLYLEDSIKYNELMEYKPVYDDLERLIGYDLYIE